MKRIGVLILVASVACSADDGSNDAAVDGETQAQTEGTESEAQGGTVRLTFTVPNGVRESPNLVSPLTGSVYGSLFLSEDVAATGPVEGAVEQASVEVTGVDIENVDVSAAAWTSEPLPPGDYTFLGFFDLNGNGTENYEPDGGDPATLPSVNQFTIVEGEETEFVVSFDLVL